MLVAFTIGVIIPGNKISLKFWEDFYGIEKTEGTLIKRYASRKQLIQSQHSVFSWIAEVNENFVNCNISKKLRISPWHSFNLFTGPFNYPIWISLPISFKIVATLLINEDSCKDLINTVLIVFCPSYTIWNGKNISKFKFWIVHRMDGHSHDFGIFLLRRHPKVIPPGDAVMTKTYVIEITNSM